MMNSILQKIDKCRSLHEMYHLCRHVIKTGMMPGLILWTSTTMWHETVSERLDEGSHGNHERAQTDERRRDGSTSG